MGMREEDKAATGGGGGGGGAAAAAAQRPMWWLRTTRGYGRKKHWQSEAATVRGWLQFILLNTIDMFSTDTLPERARTVRRATGLREELRIPDMRWPHSRSLRLRKLF
eukprot:gene10594-2716_t